MFYRNGEKSNEEYLLIPIVRFQSTQKLFNAFNEPKFWHNSGLDVELFLSFFMQKPRKKHFLNLFLVNQKMDCSSYHHFTLFNSSKVCFNGSRSLMLQNYTEVELLFGVRFICLLYCLVPKNIKLV